MMRIRHSRMWGANHYDLIFLKQRTSEQQVYHTALPTKHTNIYKSDYSEGLMFNHGPYQKGNIND